VAMQDGIVRFTQDEKLRFSITTEYKPYYCSYGCYEQSGKNEPADNKCQRAACREIALTILIGLHANAGSQNTFYHRT
jgi:hypothetical protein